MEDFFDVIKVKDFISIIRQMPLLGTEEVSLENSGGRRLARDYFSHEDLPATNRSSMDGYAVISGDTFGAGDSNPAYLQVAYSISIEDNPQAGIEQGSCAGIVTGATLPPGADSVVMIEHVHDMGQGTIEVRKPVAPGENVMLRGEDVAKGDLVMHTGQVIDPRRTGILAALGWNRVQVFKRPAVALISTGDELVDISQRPGPGYIRDVNTHALGEMLRVQGYDPYLPGIVSDDEQALKEVFSKTLEHSDVVLVSGGSSVGNRDYTLKALSEIKGLEIQAHGLAISPGKPTIFARRGRQCVWGLPGQVTSAQVVMLILVLPFLGHLQGEKDPFTLREEFLIRARLSRNLASRYGREDYVRVRLEKSGEQIMAIPVTGKSGLLRTMLQAHGLVRIPENSEGLSKDHQVLVRLF